MLASCCQFMAEGLPGVEVLRGNLPGREGPQPRGRSRDQSYRAPEDQRGRGAFASSRTPFVITVCAKGLLQFVIGPRQLRNLIAVKEPWPVTARDLEKVHQRGGERPRGGPVPGHRAQQALQATLHGCPRVLFLVAEDMGGPMDPAIGDAYVRPQGGGCRQAPLEDGLQPREGLGQCPLFSPRSRLSAMAARRSWSLRPEATK